MGTTPIPAPPVPITLTVLDPISADAQAFLAAYTATCNMYCTPVGQKLLQAELDLGHSVSSAMAKFFGQAWNAIVGLFKK